MDTCPLTNKISYRSLYPSKWFLVISFAVLLFVSGCKNKSGLTQSEDSPVVMATNPDNNAVDIPVNSTVTAVFSDQINPSTLTDTTFILRNDTVTVTGTINYSDSLATFTPSGNLSFGGVYTATITTGVENLSGITIENNYEWSFTTEEGITDTTLPQIISTNPTNEAENVSVNTEITATFSEPMNPASINTTTFTVAQGETSIPGTVELEDAIATFVPDNPMDFNTGYTATVTSGAEDTAGNPLQNNVTWSFTTETEEGITDTTLPQIISTNPTNEAENVSVNTEITATFSEPMNPASINTTTFTVAQGETSIPGTVELEDAIATFVPDNPMDFNTGYTATVTSGAEDTAGNPLQNNITWSFTTETDPDNTAPEITSNEPADEAKDVPVNANVTVTFSEAMNSKTINNTTFTLEQGNTTIEGAVSYSENTATLAPENELEFGIEYTATITTGVEDLAGNALANNFSWTFTTGEEPDNTLPQVIATNPTDGQENLPVNSNITVTFSEPMNTETLNQTTFTITQGGNSIAGAVTVTETTATFNPSNNLPFDNTFTATITTGAQDLAGNALADNFTWSFSTGMEPDMTAPEITSTTPKEGEEDVPITTNISAVFSEAVNSSTIDATTFTVSQDGSTVGGEFSFNEATVTFNPTGNLAPGSEVAITISTNVADQAGNNLASDFSWSFTTEQESTPPEVESVEPEADATGVPVDSDITVVFSEAVNASTINTTTFSVSQGGSAIPGALATDGATVTFNPTNNFATGSKVTTTITTGVQDLAGNNLASNFDWSFTTEQETTPPVVSSVDPEDGASNVPVGSNITVVFSEAVNASTINTTTFSVSQGGSAIPGALATDGATITFNPTNNFATGSEVTVNITTGVQDLAGNNLANNFEWSFTTEQEAVPPKVSSTNPNDGASDVPVGSDIKATFNEEMNPATINKNTFFVTRNGTQIAGDISYSGVTATFNPSSNLGTGRTYSVTITTGAKDLAGNALENNVNWTFTTEEETTPPVVKNTSPVDGATNVPVNTNISASFSESMDQASVQGAFTVTQNGTAVAGAVTFSGNTAIFNPTNNLGFANQVTATISTGAQDLAGNSLASNFSWSFTTEQESTPPTVSLVSPADGENNVPVNTNISVGFSEAMDQASVQNAFTVSQNGSAVAGTITFSGNTATFNPNNNLNFGTSITATISTDAQDLAGNNLQNDFVWSFTTEQETVPPKVNSTNPSDGTIDVPVSSNITATFSEAMDPATINETTFEITQGGVGVGGAVSYSNNTATFNPTNDLTFDSEYTATITTGARDLVGNALESNFTWSFTTEQETIPPEVESVEPEAGETDVSVKTVITATFSEQMDPSTINTTNFNVSQGGILVSGSVSYSGTTATFTPTSNLLFSIQYDVIITSGVQDLVGNSMTNDFRWSFTTEDIDEDIDK